MKFKFVHIKTPGWAKYPETSIYFSVIYNDGNGETEIGYIGLQENSFERGLCNNICLKTFEEFRGQGLTKLYFKEFIENGPFRFDCIRSKVDKDNIASQKIFEYAGFEKRGIRRDDEDGDLIKYGYTWKRF